MEKTVQRDAKPLTELEKKWQKEVVINSAFVLAKHCKVDRLKAEHIHGTRIKKQ